MPAECYILVGGPRTGKSTFARALREQGLPTFCCDPISLAKDVEPGVTYLPDIFAAPGMWSHASAYVAEVLFSMPGPWAVEGVSTVRALRKWLRVMPAGSLPAEHVVYLDRPWCPLLPGQASLAKGVAKVWGEVEGRLRSVVERPPYSLTGRSRLITFPASS